MKKRYRKDSMSRLLALLALALCCMGKTAAGEPFRVETFTDRWETKDSYDATHSFEASMDWPTGGDRLLVENVRNWVNQAVYEGTGLYCRGELDSGRDVLACYSNELKLSCDFYTNSLRVMKCFENEQVVSFRLEIEMYNADGISSYDCATFRKSDGHRLIFPDLFLVGGAQLESFTNSVLAFAQEGFFGWMWMEERMPGAADVDITRTSVCIDEGMKLRFYTHTNYSGNGTILCPVGNVAHNLTGEAKAWLLH